MPTIPELLSAELNQKLSYIENVIALLDEGNTVPFIARYRKELHGAMDDTTLRTLETRLAYLRSLQQRRDEVLRSIETQGKLTPELTAAIANAQTLAEVEDLYRPSSPSAGPVAPLPGKRAWNPWPPPFSARTAAPPKPWQRIMSTPARA